MSAWIGADDHERWRALFAGYERSAYRLEAQQCYGSPQQDADLATFLAGRPVVVDWSWMRALAADRRAPHDSTTKVRIVVEPVTPYTALELTIYPEMAQFGEDIRILAVPQGRWPAGQPHHDYWLFDDRDLWRMHFHENFHFKGAELVDDPDAVAEHRRARDLALAHAVPLRDYLTTRTETGDDHV